jgi:hypothetical protein
MSEEKLPQKCLTLKLEKFRKLIYILHCDTKCDSVAIYTEWCCHLEEVLRERWIP